MNSSTAIFLSTHSNGKKYFLRSTNLPLVNTYEEVCFSVVRSLAAYMVWRFPHLPPPHRLESTPIQLNHLPIPLSFPNYQAKLQPMYLEWMNLFCETIENNQAYCYQDKCYFKVEIDWSYAQLLLGNGFEKEEIHDCFHQYAGSIGLAEFAARSPPNQTKITFVSCSDHHLWDEPYVDLRAHFYGQFFDNQKWTGFNVLKDRPPTCEELCQADVVILPGSNLSVYNHDSVMADFVTVLQKVLQIKPQLKILGICYGHQLLNSIFGGKVVAASQKTSGVHPIQLRNSLIRQKNHDFLKPLREHSQLLVTQSHGDQVMLVPSNFDIIADSPTCPTEIVLSKCGKYLGMQCHPEFTPKDILTIEIQIANHQHKGQSGPVIDKLLQDMKSCKKDEGAEVLRKVISKFLRNH